MTISAARYTEAVQLIRRVPGCAGAALLQRRLVPKATYAEASEMIDQMEDDGIVGPEGACKYRSVIPWKE